MDTNSVIGAKYFSLNIDEYTLFYMFVRRKWILGVSKRIIRFINQCKHRYIYFLYSNIIYIYIYIIIWITRKDEYQDKITMKLSYNILWYKIWNKTYIFFLYILQYIKWLYESNIIKHLSMQKMDKTFESSELIRNY